MSPRALVKDGTDPEQVQRGARTVQQRAEILAASLRAVLSTPAGRLVIWSLFEDTHVYQTSLDLSGSMVYFKEGERHIGLKWRALVIACDEQLYELMEREARQRERRLDTTTAALQDAASTTAEEKPHGDD